MKPVGKVSRLFGEGGELLINLFDTYTGGIEIGEPLFVIIDKLTVPLFVNSFRRSGKGGEIAFDDIETQQRAEMLLGQKLYLRVKSDAVLSEMEQLIRQFEGLIGYSVELCEEDGERSASGEIVDFVYSELNPILIIESGGEEVLIPINSITIESVDEQQEQIKLTMPNGLLELYI